MANSSELEFNCVLVVAAATPELDPEPLAPGKSQEVAPIDKNNPNTKTEVLVTPFFPMASSVAVGVPTR